MLNDARQNVWRPRDAPSPQAPASPLLQAFETLRTEAKKIKAEAGPAEQVGMLMPGLLTCGRLPRLTSERCVAVLRANLCCNSPILKSQFFVVKDTLNNSNKGRFPTKVWFPNLRSQRGELSVQLMCQID